MTTIDSAAPVTNSSGTAVGLCTPSEVVIASQPIALDHHPEGDPDEHRHQRPGRRLPRHHPADLPAASTEHLHDRQVAVPPADRGDERVHQRQGGQREHRRRQRDRDVRQLVPQLYGAGDERCPHDGVRVGLIERIGGGIEVGARLELDEQVLRRHLDGRALQRPGAR